MRERCPVGQPACTRYPSSSIRWAIAASAIFAGSPTCEVYIALAERDEDTAAASQPVRFFPKQAFICTGTAALLFLTSAGPASAQTPSSAPST